MGFKDLSEDFNASTGYVTRTGVSQITVMVRPKFYASFTYVPGTVIHLGHASLYQKSDWHIDRYVDSDEFHEIKRWFFFKMSYLWRV
jgi:hypothetical protein